MSEDDWINELKVGDEIYHTHRYSNGNIRATVSRVTKARIFTKDDDSTYEESYWKKNGYIVGGNIWDSKRLIRPTENVKKEYELEQLIKKAKDIKEKIKIPIGKKAIVEFIDTLSKYL